MAALASVVDDADLVTDPDLIGRRLRDNSWLSPVLKTYIDDMADASGRSLDVCALVSPLDAAQLRCCVSLLYSWGAPIVVLGAGTTNFGQTTPLDGGVVIEMKHFDHVEASRDGRISAGAGATTAAVDEMAHEAGLEVPVMTTTFATATSGGWVSGGHIGLGSPTWGSIWDDNVVGATLMTVEEEPRVLSLDQSAIEPVLHSYGTTGILTDVTFRLIEAHQWTELVVCFEDFDAACRFAGAVGERPKLKIRAAAAQEPSITPCFSALRGHVEPDEAIVISIIDDDQHHVKVTARELAAMRVDGEELAVLDTRDVGDHANGHLPGSCPVPASELEWRLDGLLPRRAVRVVVIGEDDLAAHRAAHAVRRRGFTNVAVLAGGVEAWAEAGYDVHDGIHTMSKAFGEHLAHVRDTPMISADELRSRREQGQAVTLVDCRPEPEFAALHVPGAANAPGTELLARILSQDLEPGTPIAVSCAGRTRSIIGAQTLIDAGVDAPVLALENGTMGWKLAGEELAKGPDDGAAAPPSPSALQDAADRARRLAGARGVPVIGEADLAGWLADDSHTTYVFDVSSPAAYAAGHRPGFASAPGGQLLQELTARTAVPSARIVVADSDGVQSLLTAYWLRMMGREAYALPDANRGRWLETGPDAAAEPARPAKPYERSADAPQAMRDYIAWELDLLDRVDADNFDLPHGS